MTKAQRIGLSTYVQFMEIMTDYQQRQNEDPNFDPLTELYDLYTDLDDLCNQTKLNLIQQ